MGLNRKLIQHCPKSLVHNSNCNFKSSMCQCLWYFSCDHIHNLYFGQPSRSSMQCTFFVILPQQNSIKICCFQGDSGGPLVSFAGAEPTLAGVISFVHRDGCASGNPAGYVRVEQQLDFILDIVDPEPGPTVVPDEYEYQFTFFR